MVEGGLSLQRAAKQFGVSRARVEDWQFPGKGLIGRPRTMDLPDGEKRTQMAREEADRDIRQAELLVEARTAVFDVRRAEILVRKILAQRSTAMKMALADLVVQTAEDLRSPEVRPKDRALALVALRTVCERLFGWNNEPDLQSMKLARTHGDDVPTAAVNLALINTTPRQLAEMAKAKSDHDGDHDDHSDDHTGPSETECNGLSVGPSAAAPEQPPAATPRLSNPKKGGSKTPLEGQPGQATPAGHPSVSHPAPLSQTPFGQTPPQDSFDRARAEHRKANWEKYREKGR